MVFASLRTVPFGISYPMAQQRTLLYIDTFKAAQTCRGAFRDLPVKAIRQIITAVTKLSVPAVDKEVKPQLGMPASGQEMKIELGKLMRLCLKMHAKVRKRKKLAMRRVFLSQDGPKKEGRFNYDKFHTIMKDIDPTMDNKAVCSIEMFSH